MIVTKDNVKVGDKLYVVSEDKRESPYWVTIEKVGNKFVTFGWSGEKIKIGTDEMYRKDGIGSPHKIFKDLEEYNQYVILRDKRIDFSRFVESKYCILRNEISEEDMNTITDIIKKYL